MCRLLISLGSMLLALTLVGVTPNFSQVVVSHSVGQGSPEGAHPASPGSTYVRSDGGSGSIFYVKLTGVGATGWSAIGDGYSVITAGTLLARSSGSSCPSGFTEATDLDGKMLLGTTIANGNVGGTGGSSSITPTGTISTHNFTTAGNVSLLGLGTALTGPTSITPTLTGNAFDPTPPFKRVIWCRRD